jgi:uncharacterized phage-associated protein
VKNFVGFEVRKVVNLILDNFDPIQYDLTNLKLQKAAFVFHGLILCRSGEPLIRNHFETWDHGPVISNLYHELKAYGTKPVTNKITYFSYEKAENVLVEHEDVIDRFGPDILITARAILDRSVHDLYAEVHEIGGPWDLIRREHGTERSSRIPNYLIRDYFVRKYGGMALH